MAAVDGRRSRSSVAPGRLWTWGVAGLLQGLSVQEGIPWRLFADGENLVECHGLAALCDEEAQQNETLLAWGAVRQHGRAQHTMH